MQGASEKIGIEGYSPVSYFESGPEMGKPEFAHTHAGTTYYLTSQQQLNKFRFESREVRASIRRFLCLRPGN